MDDASLPLLERTLPDGRPAFVKSAGPYARLLGASRQAGKNWNDAGLIAWVTDPATGKEIVDVAASDRRRHAQQNPLKRATPALAASGPSASGKPADGPTLFTDRPDPASSRPLDQAAPRPSSAPVPPGTAGASPDDEDDLDSAGDVRDPMQASIAEDKARMARIKRYREEREWMVDLGELVPAELVRQRDAERMANLRKALMRLPREACDRANPEDPARARAAIEAVLRQTLEDFIADGRTRIDTERRALKAEQEQAHA